MTTSPIEFDTPKKRKRRLPMNEAERSHRARESAVARDVQLGWRMQEFAAVVGVSLPTLWRRVKAGDVRTVKIGGVTLVPRSEAARLGLIDNT